MLYLKQTIIFCLAFDVQKANTKSGFKPAATGFNDKKALFGNIRLKGFAALLHYGFARHIIIVGGNEARYPGAAVNRAEAIKSMLVEDFKINPGKISCIVSTPHTSGNVAAIKKYISSKGIALGQCAIVSSFYHICRASVDFFGQEIPMAIYPAEAFYLLGGGGKKAELIKTFGGGAFAKRAAEEIQGITHKIQGKYKQK